MEKYISYLPQFLIAFFFTLALTPLIISLSKRFGIIELPKNQRPDSDSTKNRIYHKNPTPKLGGLAVLVPLFIICFVFLNPTTNLIFFLIATATLALTGVFDDILNLSAKWQFFGIAIACIIAIFGSEISLGFLPSQIKTALDFGFHKNFFGAEISLTVSDIFLFFWLILCINSVKFNSGLPGLMESNMLIAFVFSFLVSVRVQDSVSATVSSAISGSLLAFIPFALPPGKIMTKGSGKLTYGFIIALLSISSQAKFGVIVTLLFLPILDALVVLYFRLKTHKPGSFFELMKINDSTHLHHILLKSGLSMRQIVVIEIAVMIFAGLILFLLSGMLRASAVAMFFIILLGFLVRVRKDS